VSVTLRIIWHKSLRGIWHTDDDYLIDQENFWCRIDELFAHSLQPVMGKNARLLKMA
jgi:hypothetical protein